MASNIFKPILGPIKEMGTFFKELASIFSKLGIAIPKILTLFEMITNPTKFVQDFLYGIIEGGKEIFFSLIEMISGSLNLKRYSFQRDFREQCMDPTLTNIIILVLCPSLALTMRVGFKNFKVILVCWVLSYFYYIPGLIYASLFLF